MLHAVKNSVVLHIKKAKNVNTNLKIYFLK